ncbi:MAG: bis(5'-nucleosyl)-tetraphosphatase (symmetrical) YqeK [Methylocystaceae bacterium]
MKNNGLPISLGQARDIIEKRLSPHRFQHSLGVASAAAKLAAQHGEDQQKAELAGLLHDYAKNLDAPTLIAVAEYLGIELAAEDRLLPDLLHGPVGALLVKQDLGLQDQQILAAISSHTMGGLSMSNLDKIIFLADMIEPGRDYPLLERLTCLCERDLDSAMIFGLDLTIKYCLEQRRLLHPLTVAVRNHFLILFPEAVIC